MPLTNRNLLQWLTDYLHNRKQRVVINGQSSSWSNICAGVPQGSVLGPVLFLIFIDDISYVVNHCHIRLFADDTSLFIEVDDAAQAAQYINADLSSINDWANKWLVSFNSSKSVSLLITNKRSMNHHPAVYLAGKQIAEVKKHKHLGVTLTRDLSWSTHLNDICEKAEKLLALLKSFKFRLDRNSLELFYTSMIRPTMEYADVLWAGATQSDLAKLDRIQLEAARVVTGATARCNTSALLNDVNWLTLSERRRRHRLCLFFKIVNGLSPPYLLNIMPSTVRARSKYNLRSADNISSSNARLRCSSTSFIHNTIGEWNILSLIQRQSDSISSFKAKLKQRDPPSNRLFYIGPRHANIIMSRLRIGCSSLNSDLCNNLHVIDIQSCRCGHYKEDLSHFLLFCPLYRDARLKLFNNIDITIDDPFILLNGSNDLSFDANCTLINAVAQFIVETNRFSF